MKFTKLSLLAILFVSFGLIFSACDETTSTSTAPVIESISPTSGVPGTIVTITGSNFGEYDQFNSQVWIGNVRMGNIVVEGNEVQWFDDEITVLIPDGAQTDDIVVKVGSEESNGVQFTVIAPDAPTELMATSIDDKTIAIKWTASSSEGEQGFEGYRLFVSIDGGDTFSPIDYDAGTTNATITNLAPGTVYVFSLSSMMTYNDSPVFSAPVSIKWSPAFRFTENINEEAITLYESASDFGSGLELHNDNGDAPKTLKVASGDNWDLGLFTSDGTVTFGSASSILSKYSSYSGTPKRVEISSTYYKANSLDDVYDSQALETRQDFSEQTFDLASIDNPDNMNLVFIVRTNFPDWNYAKVLVKYNNGFLQGSGSNRYIECVVSYQKEHVPYAF